MYAIAFDLDYNNTQAFHPTGVRQAYAEIGATLSRYGSERARPKCARFGRPGALYLLFLKHDWFRRFRLNQSCFGRIQQSVFMNQDSDLTAVTFAMTALKALPWFSRCVKDIRAFRVEDWSDFTPFFESNR